MTLVEYANKLGINLNSAQIEIMNLYEKHKDESLIISLPRLSGRQLMNNLIQRKQGYDQGRRETIDYLVQNGYIKCGFDTEYLIEQMEKDRNIRDGSM